MSPVVCHIGHLETCCSLLICGSNQGWFNGRGNDTKKGLVANNACRLFSPNYEMFVHNSWICSATGIFDALFYHVLSRWERCQSTLVRKQKKNCSTTLRGFRIKLIRMQSCKGLLLIQGAKNLTVCAKCGDQWPESLRSLWEHIEPANETSDEQRTNTKEGPWMRAVCIAFKQTTCLVSLLNDLGGILPEVSGIYMS